MLIEGQDDAAFYPVNDGYHSETGHRSCDHGGDTGGHRFSGDGAIEKVNFFHRPSGGRSVEVFYIFGRKDDGRN